MGYCKKCGKELNDNPPVCPFCGFVFKNYDITAVLKSPYFKPTVVRSDTKKMWIMSMLGGLFFGIIMGVFQTMIIGEVGIVIGLLGGAFFSVFFGGTMHLVLILLEKKFAELKSQIARDKKIIVDGAANLNGDGGWLFITDMGVEYHTHKVNFSNIHCDFPHDVIQSITKEGKKLIVVANNTKYKFVVNNVDMWLTAIQAK